MNKEGLKELIRESFRNIREKDNEKEKKSSSEDEEDPIAKWKDFCSLCDDPGNRDFSRAVSAAISDDHDILMSVLEALQDDEHVELHNEIYNKVRKLVK